MILEIDLLGIAEGPAIIIIGILGLMLWVAITFRNPLAVVLWGISVLVLIFSSLFGIPANLFWFGSIGTLIIVIFGVIARVAND